MLYESLFLDFYLSVPQSDTGVGLLGRNRRTCKLISTPQLHYSNLTIAQCLELQHGYFLLGRMGY